MAITQTLSLLCHRFRHSEYQSQSDDDDDDDTEEEEDESLKGIDWGLAEALIEPLSLREDFFFFLVHPSCERFHTLISHLMLRVLYHSSISHHLTFQS